MLHRSSPLPHLKHQALAAVDESTFEDHPETYARPGWLSPSEPCLRKAASSTTSRPLRDELWSIAIIISRPRLPQGYPAVSSHLATLQNQLFQTASSALGLP